MQFFDVEADDLQQLERVSRCCHARLEAVVEREAEAFVVMLHALREVHRLARGGQFVARRQLEVVCRDEANHREPEEVAQDAAYRDLAFGGVRALQHLVEEVEQQSLDRIRLAFRDGEYTSALRSAYRLPPSVPKAYSDGVKVAGWYNLAIVALRAGDCTVHHSYLAHMANANTTDVPRVAHIIIYMDADTTYNGNSHVITDPLHLKTGDPLDGDLFPKV